MAENEQTPMSGAVPPKPAEAAKVQPKKETVRINLPPKPTAAPTIKIPAPAARAATSSAPPAVPVAAASSSAPPAVPARAGAAAAAPTQQRMGAAPRAPMAPAVGGLDKALAIAAAVVGVAALVRVLLLG